jgi:hypothetical protein
VFVQTSSKASCRLYQTDYVITVSALDCYVPLRNVILTDGLGMCIAHCADVTLAGLRIRLSECHL